MTFASYAEFFPFYVSQHSRQATRWLHLIGTMLGLAAEVAIIATGHWELIWAFPVIGYAFAWFAHFVVEENKPATFGHPLYSLRGDFHMLSYMLTGRDRVLASIAERTLAELDRTKVSG